MSLTYTVMQSGGNYTSLNAALAANEQNLVANMTTINFVIDGSWTVDDTTNVSVTGYTSNSNYYVNIYTTSTARHNGIAKAVSGLNNYRLVGSGYNCGSFYFNVGYTVVKGLEVYQGSVDMEASNCTFAYGVVHDANGCDYFLVGGWASGLWYNCVFYGYTGDCSYWGCVMANSQSLFYNCTIVDNPNFAAIYGWENGPSTFVNCYCGNNSGSDFGGSYVNSSSDYNVSSVSDAPGTHSATGKTAYATYFVSITDATANLTLLGHTSSLWGVGGNNLSYIFTDDITGKTRSFWDVGAFEYGTYTPPTSIYSILTILKASISSIDALTIANVSSINGLS